MSEIESLTILNNQPIPSLFDDDSYKPKASDEAYDYAFNLDEIDTKHFPIELFRKYSKDLYDTNHLNQLRRGHFQGELHLRFQLAFYLFTNRGVICDPESNYNWFIYRTISKSISRFTLYFNVYYRKTQLSTNQKYFR